MSRVRFVCLSVVAALVSVGVVAAPAHAATATISGVVRDAAGDRYAGLTIRAYSDDSSAAWDNVVTSTDGSFQLSVERGTVIRLGVSHTIYNTELEVRTSSFAVTEDRTEDFYMPIPGSVLATVAEGDDGSAVGDARVQSLAATASLTTPSGLVMESLLGPTTCITAPDGTCHVLALSHGETALFKVTPPGRPSESFPGIAVPTQITPHTFSLAPAPQVSGVLRRQDGTPLSGAQVRLVGSGTVATTSRADGSWSLRSTPGLLRLDIKGSVTDAGWTVPYEFESQTFEHNATRTVDLSLPALENRRILVLDAARAPLTGVQVVPPGDSSVVNGHTEDGMLVTAYLARSGTPGGPSCAATNASGECELPVFANGSNGPVRVLLPHPDGYRDFQGSAYVPGAPRETTVRVAGYAVARSAGSVPGSLRVYTELPTDVSGLAISAATLPDGIDALVGAVDYDVVLAPGSSSATVRLRIPGSTAPNALLRLGPSGTVKDVSTDAVIQSYDVRFTVTDGSQWDEDGTVDGKVSGTVVPVRREQLRVLTSTLATAAVGTPYSASLVGSGPVPPYTWSLASGSLPPGLALAPDGSVTGTPTAVGSAYFYVRMRESTGGAPSALYPVRLDVVPIIVTTTAVPDGYVGASYSTTLKASSAYPAWRLVGGALPPGYRLSSGGVVSGTATTAGTYSFAVTATRGGSTSPRQNLTLTVHPMQVATTSLPDAPIWTSYSQKLTALGGRGTLVWSIADGALPPGLTLGPWGTVSGRPTTVGTYDVTVRVTDSSSPKQVATRTLSITVTPMEIVTSSLPAGKKGAWYSTRLIASGGKPTLVWSLVGGALPTGLNLSSAGRITGYPKATGTWTFTVRLTDASVPKNVATATLTLTIA